MVILFSIGAYMITILCHDSSFPGICANSSTSLFILLLNNLQMGLANESCTFIIIVIDCYHLLLGERS